MPTINAICLIADGMKDRSEQAQSALYGLASALTDANARAEIQRQEGRFATGSVHALRLPRRCKGGGLGNGPGPFSFHKAQPILRRSRYC